jgi:hypothetical protein
MKRFVWLTLFAFCTALAQVQPVDLAAKKSDVCGCCEKPGACGMPDCVPLPVASHSALVAETPNGQRAEARRVTPASRIKRENFHAKFASRPAKAPVLHAPPGAVAAVSGPLFQVHCSYLI